MSQRRLQLTAIVNQSLRSNFQVGHDIAIGRTVAAEDDVPRVVGVPVRSRRCRRSYASAYTISSTCIFFVRYHHTWVKLF